MRTPGLQLVVPVLAIVVSGCASAAQGAATSPRPSAPRLTPSTAASPVAKPTPRLTVIDAAFVADELGTIEQAIRLPSTPPADYASLGQREQLAYHRLAAHPDWVPAVLNAVPASVRSAIQDNPAAAQQIDSLNGSRRSPPPR